LKWEFDNFLKNGHLEQTENPESEIKQNASKIKKFTKIFKNSLTTLKICFFIIFFTLYLQSTNKLSIYSKRTFVIKIDNFNSNPLLTKNQTHENPSILRLHYD